MRVTIERLRARPAGTLAALVTDSERSRLRFVRRLVDEWTSGANRFARPGEALFVARGDGRVLGVCGLNVDPYTEAARVGRVRHLYVLEADRRHGVGRRLLAAVVAAARGRFDRLRLRTENPVAATFYEALGFVPCGEPDGTHVMALRVSARTRGTRGGSSRANSSRRATRSAGARRRAPRRR